MMDGIATSLIINWYVNIQFWQYMAPLEIIENGQASRLKWTENADG